MEPLDTNNIEPKVISSNEVLDSIELLINYYKCNNLDYLHLMEIKNQVESSSYIKKVQTQLKF